VMMYHFALLGSHRVIELQLPSSVTVSKGHVHQRLRRVHGTSQDQGLLCHFLKLSNVLFCGHLKVNTSIIGLV